jgi:hypothetical protein
MACERCSVSVNGKRPEEGENKGSTHFGSRDNDTLPGRSLWL